MSNTPAVDLLDKISMYGKKKKGAMRKPERPMSSERSMTKEANLIARLLRGGASGAKGAVRGGAGASLLGAGLLGLQRNVPFTPFTRGADLGALASAQNYIHQGAQGALSGLEGLARSTPGAAELGRAVARRGNALQKATQELEAGAGLAGAMGRVGEYIDPNLLGAGALAGGALGLGRGLLRGGRAVNPSRAAAYRAAGYGMAARPPMDPRMLALAGAGGGALLAGQDNRMLGALAGAGLGALGPRLAMARRV
tara:strand:+ start:723 stop:1484 length:762 start_codon:yes stop_codon:yes gene_type:complete